MSALNATVFALQYGLPLYAYAKLALPFVEANAVNVLVHSSKLATPQSTTVVLPNVDTLYSTALYDLSQNDLRVTIPEIGPDRYWSFAFYDPFGNNFATPSSIHDNSGGEYLLRYANDGTWGLQPSNDLSGYQGYINSPTVDGTILGRILLKNNNSDVHNVQTYINASSAYSVPRKSLSPLKTTSLTTKNLSPYNSASTPLAILQLLANFLSTNPPFNVSTAESQALSTALLTAGISSGTYRQPSGVNLTTAYTQALSSIRTTATTPTIFTPFNNGWQHSIPQGLFSSAYISRAFTAQSAYLELTNDQVLYAMTVDQSMQLSSDESYIYTFSGKPPLGSDGFWSLTLYNEEGYLVENRWDKYAVGDRSNITFANGAPVYGSPTAGGDGVFQVLVQGADVQPPSNWTNNWLPSPTDSVFSTTLRLYAPLSALYDGTYQFPIITKGDAIQRDDYD